MSVRKIPVEGVSSDEVMAQLDYLLEEFVLVDEPVLFNAGGAEILGKFSRKPDSLVVELTRIDDGGEGVLPALWSVAERYAKRQKLTKMEWFVHAVNRDKPNLKLKQLLEEKGFHSEDKAESGPVYYLAHTVPSA